MPKKKKNVVSCAICMSYIDRDKDNYVHLIDYFKGKFHKEGFYHHNCYVNKISKKDNEISMMKGMAHNLLKRANKMMDQAGIENEEQVYSIK